MDQNNLNNQQPGQTPATFPLPEQPQQPIPEQNQQPQVTYNPNDPVDHYGVGLQSPIITPNQFDGLKPIPLDPSPEVKTGKHKKELTAEQMTKRFMILSIILGVLAIIGIGLGIFGLIDAGNTRDQLETATKNLNTKTAIVNQVSTDTGKTIKTVSDLPDYAPVSGYVYLTEWNLKIKLDTHLSDVSYILDAKYRPQICFTGHEAGLSYFPSFADIDLNPSGMGCLTRVKTSEGNVDENGISFGDKVFTDGEYSYFYYKDPNVVFSDNDAEKGLEARAVELIRNMLTDSANLAHYE